MTKDKKPVGEAERLLAHPLIIETFDELERDAMETAVHAKALDDETRRAAMIEVRAIRALRQKLMTLAFGDEFGGKTNLPKTPAVA